MKKILFLIIAIIMFSGVNVYAQTMSKYGYPAGYKSHNHNQSNTVRALINANNEIGISYNYLSRYYTERIGDNESGHISGIGLSITGLGNILSVPLVYEHIGYTNNFGKFNYTSAAQGFSAKTNTQILGVSARVGKAFIINPKTMLIPYLAYNYVKWDRNMGNTYVGNIEYLGYQEIYSYDALGLGVIGEYAINNALVLKGRVQYSRMLSNTLNAHDTPYFGFVLPTIAFSLGNSPIYTIGVSIDYDLYGPVHITAGIKYLKTYFGKSNVNTLGIYEPDSMTEATNYSLGLAYSF